MMGLTMATVIKVKTDKGEELSWNGVQNLHYYKLYFEGEYIKQTTEFYEKQAAQWISSMSSPEYVKIAHESLKKEEEKVINFLDKETRPKLVTLLEDKIIISHCKQVADMEKTGVSEMFKNKRTEELQKIYELFVRRPPTLPNIISKLGPYVISRGKALGENKEISIDPVLYIAKLVELKTEMDNIVTGAFHGNDQFIVVNDQSFQTIMDEFERAPKYLAFYIDYFMKTGLRGKDSEMEEIISKAFGLFKLLKQKDTFTLHHQVGFGLEFFYLDLICIEIVAAYVTL